ncbi:hypothetical protein AJ79_00777 [Helicocarpus griseus UAMH5409]|uniref:Uncharacterized protein n=1 Tax=Helicocarpus griseus UAMH5409 TaxID=1447875 RepID=A0A2B7YAD2_9EURO|nr:hypothetical protein AJ79_00777 [Helicocarpus griseus UAMH5409]
MIHTEIQIDAPPSVVRTAYHDLLLTGYTLDFAAIPTYHTAFLKKIVPQNTDRKGTPEPGDNLSCTVNTMTFSPVVEVNSPTEFAWRGTLGSTVIFTGVHSFKFLAVGDSAEKTRFVHSEDFGGAFSVVFGLIGQKNTKMGFEKFNEDFKRHVENKNRGS